MNLFRTLNRVQLLLVEEINNYITYSIFKIKDMMKYSKKKTKEIKLLEHLKSFICYFFYINTHSIYFGKVR
jgi:hypothetical protein